MFNLDQGVVDWRRQMVSAGLTSPELLDELENHLRDDVEEQVGRGADVEVAFESAVRRLGSAGVLSDEFAKCRPSRSSRAWGFWRTFYFSASGIAIVADLWTVFSVELSMPARAAGACVVSGLAWYLLRLPFLSWGRGCVARARLLCVMKVMGIIVPLWVLWAALTAIRWIHLDIGIVPSLTMWSLCLAFGLTGLVCALHDRCGGGGEGAWPTPHCPPPGPLSPPRPCPPEFAIPVPPAAAFAPIAREALDLAREEALRLGHDFIGTEHVLLGVLRLAGGALAQVLERSQIQRDALRREIERLVAPFPRRPANPLLPLTPRAQKALRFADAEAAALEHPLVGPEHVLLGLLREGSGVAAMALSNLGVQPERLRAEVRLRNHLRGCSDLQSAKKPVPE